MTNRTEYFLLLAILALLLFGVVLHFHSLRAIRPADVRDLLLKIDERLHHRLQSIDAKLDRLPSPSP